MSLIKQIGKNKENLSTIVAAYCQDLVGVENILNIENKSIEQANRESAYWQYFYDCKKTELHTLAKFIEAEIEAVRGNLFKTLLKTNQRDMSDRARDKFIDAEPAYLEIYEIYLEIRELYDKYSAVVDAFTARGYALNNITKARIAEVQNMIIS